MSVSQVSFQGRVPVIPAKTIKKATAEELSAAINNTHHLFGYKPVRPSSGISMIEKNPGCFDLRTHTMTEKGQACFDNVNLKQLGVTAESKVSDFIIAIRDFIVKNADEDGNISRSFDTLV